MAVLSKIKSLLPFLSALACATPLNWQGEAGPVRRGLTNAVDILNYALTLEHIEDTFYRTGLANFTADSFAAAGFDSSVHSNIVEVAADEANHVKFLTGAISALNAAPVQECTYAFPVTDVASFLAVASILEGVGVSAYLGAAKDIKDGDYLTAAGSILTVEARHSSYIRGALDEAPFPAPYDIPLQYNQVYSLAAPFFVSCPSTNPQLPLKAFPRMAVSSTSPVTPGSTIRFITPGTHLLPSGNVSIPLYAAWMQATGPVFSDVIAIDEGLGPFETVVPATVLPGQTAFVLSNCGERVGDDTTLAGPALVEVLAK